MPQVLPGGHSHQNYTSREKSKKICYTPGKGIRTRNVDKNVTPRKSSIPNERISSVLKTCFDELQNWPFDSLNAEEFFQMRERENSAREEVLLKILIMYNETMKKSKKIAIESFSAFYDDPLRERLELMCNQNEVPIRKVCGVQLNTLYQLQYKLNPLSITCKTYIIYLRVRDLKKQCGQKNVTILEKPTQVIEGNIHDVKKLPRIKECIFEEEEVDLSNVFTTPGFRRKCIEYLQKERKKFKLQRQSKEIQDMNLYR